MIRKVYFILALLLTTGCITTTPDMIQSVKNNYATVVFEDGINLEEAKIIAQRTLIKKGVVNIYTLSEPVLAREMDINHLRDYPSYWFIYFEETRPSRIPFIFMVVINKQTGRIKFADDYNEGNTWILEAALLR